MILALNANKPAAMNFSQNLSPELSNSLSIFIKEVFKEK